MRLILSTLLGAILSSNGCLYRMDVAQGNYLTQEQLDQIKIGMTRSQVEFALGSPALVDPYAPDVWVYNYFFYDGNSDKSQSESLLLTFSGDKLQKIRGQYPDEPRFQQLPKP